MNTATQSEVSVSREEENIKVSEVRISIIPALVTDVEKPVIAI